MEQLYVSKSVQTVPQGAQRVIANYFQLSTLGFPVDNKEKLKSMTFKNTGAVTKNHLSIYLYRDKNKNGYIDDGATYFIKDNNIISEGEYITLNISKSFEGIPGGSTYNYFLLFDLAASANYGSAKLDFTFVNACSTADPLNGFVTSNFVLISTNVRRLYNYHVSALGLSYEKINKQTLYLDSKNIKLVTLNLKAEQDNGVRISMNIYVDRFQKEIIGDLFLYSNSNFILSKNIQSNTLTNLYVSKDDFFVKDSNLNYQLLFTPANNLKLGTTMNFRITNIEGVGINTKYYPNTVYSTLPTTSIQIGGLDVSANVLVSGSTYISGAEIPVFYLELKSYFTKSTANILYLTGKGELIFSNSKIKNYLSTTFIYEDTNNNRSFDPNIDSRICTVNYGDYSFVSRDTIILTINRVISDYISSESKHGFFINVIITTNTEEGKKAELLLNDLRYTSEIDGYNHSLASEITDLPIAKFKTKTYGKIIIEDLNILPPIAMPQGSKDNIMYYLNISHVGISTRNGLYLHSLTFQNLGTVDSDHIDFSLYRDNNADKKLNIESDTKLLLTKANLQKSNYIITINNIAEFITKDSSEKIFLTLEISPTATYGSKVCVLKLIGSQFIDEPNLNIFETVLSGNFTLTKDISISSLQMNYTKSTQNIIFPDSDKVHLFDYELKIHQDNINVLSFNFKIEANTNQSLGKLVLLQDEDPIRELDGSDVIIASSDLIQQSSFELVHGSAKNLFDNSSNNYILALILNPTASAGVSLNIITQKVYGQGKFSAKNNYVYNLLPSLNVLVAGILFSSTSNLQDTTYIGGIEYPMTRFTARSYYLALTLNTIDLYNNKDIGFAHYDGNKNKLINRIDKVAVYTDSYANKIWDNHDRTITSQTSFTSVSGNYETVSLTLNQKISTYNAENDEVLFYINYEPNINSEIGKKAELKYSDLTFTDPFNDKNHSLKDTVESFPPVSFSIGQVDVVFSTYSIIESTHTIQGEYLKKLFNFSIQARWQDITSISIKLHTNLDILKGNDSGIKRIYLVEDISELGVPDKVHDFKNIFSDGYSVELSIGELRQKYDEYKFFILANYGSDISLAQFGTYPLNIYMTVPTNNTSNNYNIAGVFPIPRPAYKTLITANLLSIEVLSITPSIINSDTNDDMQIVFNLKNAFPSPIYISQFYPQFFKENIGSMNISYQFNYATTETWPITIDAETNYIATCSVSVNEQYEPTPIILDALAKYTINNSEVLLSRKKLVKWQNIVTGNKNAEINKPQGNIFYQEFPGFIDHVEREHSGITSDFRNGEMLQKGNYLRIYFINQGQEFDLINSIIKFNDVTLNYREGYTTDLKSGFIRLGSIQEDKGTYKIYVTDLAGNKFPETSIQYYIDSSFFVKNFLPYPSKVNQKNINNNPMKFGFLLSKPAEIRLYLFNHIGQKVWYYHDRFYQFGYKEINFNGILSNGNILGKGIYVLKLVATEIGGETREKLITKFIVY